MDCLFSLSYRLKPMQVVSHHHKRLWVALYLLQGWLGRAHRCLNASQYLMHGTTSSHPFLSEFRRDTVNSLPLVFGCRVDEKPMEAVCDSVCTCADSGWTVRSLELLAGVWAFCGFMSTLEIIKRMAMKALSSNALWDAYDVWWILMWPQQQSQEQHLEDFHQLFHQQTEYFVRFLLLSLFPSPECSHGLEHWAVHLWRSYHTVCPYTWPIHLLSGHDHRLFWTVAKLWPMQCLKQSNRFWLMSEFSHGRIFEHVYLKLYL